MQNMSLSVGRVSWRIWVKVRSGEARAECLLLFRHYQLRYADRTLCRP